MALKLKDPVSGITHFIGALLSVPALVILVYCAATNSTVWHVVSFSVFGATLILLYTISTLYHTLPLTSKGTLRLKRLDHMAIYLLIVGTYTPVCLVTLRGAWGWSLLGSIWGIAVAGIVLKCVWLNAPRWLSTLFYTGMGWLVIIAFMPLLRTVPLQGIGWLVAGGLLYSIGALIYATKRPRTPLAFFGFHEIFHLFVLAGSFCHFWLMYRFILYL